MINDFSMLCIQNTEAVKGFVMPLQNLYYLPESRLEH